LTANQRPQESSKPDGKQASHNAVPSKNNIFVEVLAEQQRLYGNFPIWFRARLMGNDDEIGEPGADGRPQSLLRENQELLAEGWALRGKLRSLSGELFSIANLLRGLSQAGEGLGPSKRND
jgi:hypothetical protein